MGPLAHSGAVQGVKTASLSNPKMQVMSAFGFKKNCENQFGAILGFKWARSGAFFVPTWGRGSKAEKKPNRWHGCLYIFKELNDPDLSFSMRFVGQSDVYIVEVDM